LLPLARLLGIRKTDLAHRSCSFAGFGPSCKKRALDQTFPSSPRRGFWQLTNEGRTFVAKHPTTLLPEEVERLAVGFMDVRLGPSPTGESLASPSLLHVPFAESAVASPDDRLGEALSELRQSVAAELLDSLSVVSPSFFETIVLDLLHRMGYGASRADLQRVGGSGDGGIDGVISLDKLGLEKVYVQAKRWQSTVGRPEIQGFYGALAGQRANKGVFITTSSYTSQAIEFAKSVERIVLVDGPRMAELMIDHEVGVSARTIKVPKLDSDYFDEESV
ncbi:restriction endonuclease, partial [Variovorax sp. RB3P1]|uniref:restriction endonuclease n=1 Tax=Variovorax sp. RB3P1 TaxID=3443732 RepID=UPI003F460D03